MSINCPKEEMSDSEFSDFVMGHMTGDPLEDNDERISLKWRMEDLVVDATKDGPVFYRERKTE